MVVNPFIGASFQRDTSTRKKKSSRKVQKTRPLDRRLVEQKTGVHYALYAYDGHPEAEYVIVVMGSGAVTCSETAKYLQEKGEKASFPGVVTKTPWSNTAKVGHAVADLAFVRSVLMIF